MAHHAHPQKTRGTVSQHWIQQLNSQCTGAANVIKVTVSVLHQSHLEGLLNTDLVTLAQSICSRV
jgi:hypothetical protein